MKMKKMLSLLNKELNKQTKDLEKWKQYHLNPITSQIKIFFKLIVSRRKGSKVVERQQTLSGTKKVELK